MSSEKFTTIYKTDRCTEAYLKAMEYHHLSYRTTAKISHCALP